MGLRSEFGGESPVGVSNRSSGLRSEFGDVLFGAQIGVWGQNSVWGLYLRVGVVTLGAQVGVWSLESSMRLRSLFRFLFWVCGRRSDSELFGSCCVSVFRL